MKLKGFYKMATHLIIQTLTGEPSPTTTKSNSTFLHQTIISVPLSLIKGDKISCWWFVLRILFALLRQGFLSFFWTVNDKLHLVLKRKIIYRKNLDWLQNFHLLVLTVLTCSCLFVLWLQVNDLDLFLVSRYV